MFFDSLKSKLNLIFQDNSPVIISETFGDLQNIVAIYCYLLRHQDTIIICKTIEEAKNLTNLANSFFGLEHTIFFPDINIEPYTQVATGKDVSKARIDALYSIINRPGPKLVITTVLGFIFKNVPKSYLEYKQLTLKVGDTISFKSVLDFLSATGYLRKDKVSFQGEYAVRGDIIDVFPANSLPIRINFFSDIIESIKVFDVESQRTSDSLQTATINLPLEIVSSPEIINNFSNNYSKYFTNTSKSDEILHSLIEEDLAMGLPLDAEHYFPLYFNETQTIAQFLNVPAVIFNNTSIFDIENIKQIYQDNYISRNNSYSVARRFPLLPPELLLLTKSETDQLLNTHKVIAINNNSYPEGTSHNVSLFSKNLQFLFKNKSNINDKGKELVKLLKDHNEAIFVLNMVNPNSQKYIGSLLAETHIASTSLDNLNSFELKEPVKPRVFFVKEENLTQGFVFDNIIFICEYDFFISHNVHKKSSARNIRNPFNTLKELNVGELLVHVKHGVGRYLGLTTLQPQGLEHDFLELEYSGGDKLYIPVENIDLVNKYGNLNSTAILDKLGNNTWEKRKAAIKEKLHEIAYDLIKLAAVRNLKTGPNINPNPDGYLEFINAFPYIETEDQLKAIEDIREDFSKGQVVDRLICGDVGFGKTEVAMRAAYLAVSSGYQVAILAPTTLLVRQHYWNFVKRFEPFSVVVKQLSRFISNKEKTTIKKDLSEGKIDIIIGTHALFSQTINFKRLGLLIIDEEQNFGVVHKEKIKALRENIHTFNLTATPIPRTLQMALTGVKSLSIITTPPIDKLPIKTYVMPFDELTIKDAILREVKRNGQVYVVAPYISELHEIEEFLINLNLDLKILILHGRMDPEQIENHMNDFQDNKFNILLSTNIIESGIDLDNVNTMIIVEADKFGLSQLYQLRGRIGRGKVQGYAYITYSNVHNLTSTAKKRLEAIQNLDYLGAGFTLAEHDLDIRGAGNILGKEQSGHIKGIGIELYNKFLSEEINKLKLKSDDTEVNYDSLSPNVVLPIASLIPGSYVNDISTRMEFYQKFANVSSFAEIEQVVNELIDRFGSLPPETENLVNIIKIKILCKQLGIEKLIAGPKAVTLYFYNNQPMNADSLIQYIQQNPSVIKLQRDFSIIYTYNSQNKEELVKEVITFLFNLRSIFGLIK